MTIWCTQQEVDLENSKNSTAGSRGSHNFMESCSSTMSCGKGRSFHEAWWGPCWPQNVAFYAWKLQMCWILVCMWHYDFLVYRLLFYSYFYRTTTTAGLLVAFCSSQIGSSHKQLTHHSRPPYPQGYMCIVKRIKRNSVIFLKIAESKGIPLKRVNIYTTPRSLCSSQALLTQTSKASITLGCVGGLVPWKVCRMSGTFYGIVIV